MQQRITRIDLLPDGLDWDHREARSFTVAVEYRGTLDGKDRFGVFHQGSELSRAGNWEHWVPRFKQHQYRWETLDEALTWARRVINDVTVNGRTWEQWQQHWAALEQQRQQEEQRQQGEQ